MSSTEEDRLTVRASNFFGLSMLAGEVALGRTSFAIVRARKYGVLPCHPLVRF